MGIGHRAGSDGLGGFGASVSRSIVGAWSAGPPEQPAALQSEDGLAAVEAPGIVADAGRLEALLGYGVLDTPQEEAFDAIVRLATKLCGAPVGMITLVASDRQWFKARVGFEETETPLDHSICVHALPETALLVIPDLTQDIRTSTNRAVTGPSAMRFYAGAPLRSLSGHGLGTLCVIDRAPREGGLTTDQAEILRTLGAEVMALIEARRALRSQEDVAAKLQASEAGLPPFGGPGLKLVHRRSGVDPVCGPRPMQVLGL